MKDHSMGSLVRAGIVGTLLGGGVGFVLGILLAPEEGQKVRRRLAYQLEHLSDQLGEFVDQLTHPDQPNDARVDADALVADARTKARKIQDDIDALMGEARRHGPNGDMPMN